MVQRFVVRVGMAYELRPATAPQYLARHGVLPEGSVTEAEAVTLGGGVSNRVVRVIANDSQLVLKQPRSDLAVEDDWPADVTRVHNEAAASRAYRRILRDVGTDAITAPEIVFEHETDHVIVSTCAPLGARTWKDELLDRRVDVDLVRRLGRALGIVHRRTEDDEAIRERFTDTTPFVQLRIDPYHEMVAQRHPDLAPSIRVETERVLGVDRTLVHGDYSPKNVLVDRSTDPPTLWIIDFEVAHVGDPAFDAAFMLNHLLIKSVYNRDAQAAYLDAARAFRRAYHEATDWDIEGTVVRELAVLLLARIDGKSPVGYIQTEETAEILRRIAKRTLEEDAETLQTVFSMAREEASA